MVKVVTLHVTFTTTIYVDLTETCVYKLDPSLKRYDNVRGKQIISEVS